MVPRFLAVGMVCLVLLAPVLAQQPAPVEPAPGLPPDAGAFLPTNPIATTPTTLEMLGSAFDNTLGLLDDSRAWFNAEYLLWWIRPGAGELPLATTGSPGSGAVLGRPGTSVALARSTLEGPVHGFRFTTGMWLSPRPVKTLGFEVSGFFIPDRIENTVISSGSQDIARPFNDSIIRGENSLIVASPGVFTGQVGLRTTSQLWGLDVGPLLRVVESGSWSLDQTIGFKVLGLDESFAVNSRTTALPNGIIAFNGTNFTTGGTSIIDDTFTTRNRFFGGSLGGRLNYDGDRLSASFGWRIAGGIAQQQSQIAGTTRFITPQGASTVINGGFLVNPALISTQKNSEFALAGDVNVKLGYRVTSRVLATVGYEYAHVTRFVRPDENLSRDFSSNVLATSPNFGQNLAGGGVRPTTPRFTPSDFWLQGLSFGLQIKY